MTGNLVVLVQQCYYDLVFTYRGCLTQFHQSQIVLFFLKKEKKEKVMVLCMDYLIVFSNFECLLNLDREICLAKEINILILIMLIRFVMAVIKGID